MPLTPADKQLPVVRVLIIAEFRPYRDAVARVLARDSTIQVRSDIPDIRRVIDGILKWPPDVVLLDLARPKHYALMNALIRRRPRVAVLIIGVDGSEEEVAGLFETGVSGYIAHDSSLEELIHIVKTAAESERADATPVANTLVPGLMADSEDRANPTRGWHTTLTRREREIVHLLQWDLTNKEIAVQLGIEVATVKNHVHDVLAKVCARRRGEVSRLLKCV